MPRGKQKPFNQTVHSIFMHELLTIGGIAFLVMNGSFTFFLFRFIEKLEDPAYEEKIFNKTIWRKK